MCIMSECREQEPCKNCKELIALQARAYEARTNAEVEASKGGVPAAMWWADEYHRRWSAYITRKAVIFATKESK